MHTIPLSPNYTLAIEQYQNLRVRLLIFKNGEEYVCRKESLYKLKQFLALDEGRAFKGRLQLVKDGDVIAVEVKGEVLGRITLKGLEKQLQP
jgi:RNA binding exosome subunit